MQSSVPAMGSQGARWDLPKRGVKPMGAGKPSPLGRQPGRSDGKHFPPILGRKASWSSFRRNSPNSRNGALPEVSPGDIPSHHPATHCPGWAAASGAPGFPAAPRHAPPALLSLTGCFAILPAQDLHAGSARPAAKSRWRAARLPHSASLQPCPAQPPRSLQRGLLR